MRVILLRFFQPFRKTGADFSGPFVINTVAPLSNSLFQSNGQELRLNMIVGILFVASLWYIKHQSVFQQPVSQPSFKWWKCEAWICHGFGNRDLHDSFPAQHDLRHSLKHMLDNDCLCFRKNRNTKCSKWQMGGGKMCQRRIRSRRKQRAPF